MPIEERAVHGISGTTVFAGRERISIVQESGKWPWTWTIAEVEGAIISGRWQILTGNLGLFVAGGLTARGAIARENGSRKPPVVPEETCSDATG